MTKQKLELTSLCREKRPKRAKAHPRQNNSETWKPPTRSYGASRQDAIEDERNARNNQLEEKLQLGVQEQTLFTVGCEFV
jgi:hypothetical protein